MTPIKLAMLALALVALVAGALIVKHDATVGGTLLVVGGKLVGLTFPEIGAKKGPPSGGQSEGDVDVFPQTSDGKPMPDSAALLSWHVAPLGLRLAAGVLLACLLSCAQVRPPCDEAKLRAVDEAYVARVIAVCLPKYDSKEDCPEWPALQATHRAELKAACPQ